MTELPRDLQDRVDELVRGPQYQTAQEVKEAALLPLLADLCRYMGETCPPYGRFLHRSGRPIEEWRALTDIPPLPVSMFKKFILSALPPEKVVRELRSSATTGQQPSRILIDKATAFRQARALASILGEYIGPKRRPFLVLDEAEVTKGGGNLSARGAGIRGIANFASETVYALESAGPGRLVPDLARIESFFSRHRDEEVLLFGFTFMVWTHFVLEAEKQGLTFDATRATVLHSGGWKKLEEQAVSRDVFNSRVADVVGCDASRVLNFYGMVEQIGTVFVDCEEGHKHAPAFGDVVIRRPLTLDAVPPGETGIIEVLSLLPTSYPGQALITEDQARLMGIDDCGCGRMGKHFLFTSRIERAEIRGCGDTFAGTRRLG